MQQKFCNRCNHAAELARDVMHMNMYRFIEKKFDGSHSRHKQDSR